VAFMDLSGAYDSIDRKLLFWKLQHQLGIADHTSDTLRDLYCGTDYVVKGGGAAACLSGSPVACGRAAT
jgi:hypothetical protein